jgi:hypothetical protein
MIVVTEGRGRPDLEEEVMLWTATLCLDLAMCTFIVVCPCLLVYVAHRLHWLGPVY